MMSQIIWYMHFLPLSDVRFDVRASLILLIWGYKRGRKRCLGGGVIQWGSDRQEKKEKRKKGRLWRERGEKKRLKSEQRKTIEEERNNSGKGKEEKDNFKCTHSCPFDYFFSKYTLQVYPSMSLWLLLLFFFAIMRPCVALKAQLQR